MVIYLTRIVNLQLQTAKKKGKNKVVFHSLYIDAAPCQPCVYVCESMCAVGHGRNPLTDHQCKNTDQQDNANTNKTKHQTIDQPTPKTMSMVGCSVGWLAR